MQWGGLFICLLFAPTYYKTLGYTSHVGNRLSQLWFDEDKSRLVKQCGKKERRDASMWEVWVISVESAFMYVRIYLYLWPLKTQIHKLTRVHNTLIKSAHRLSIFLWIKPTLHQCFYRCVTCSNVCVQSHPLKAILTEGSWHWNVSYVVGHGAYLSVPGHTKASGTRVLGVSRFCRL